MLFTTTCLLFSSSRSLLNVSCIFSILFLRFWNIFTIITLNFIFQVECLFPHHFFGLVGVYLAPSSAVCFSVFSFFLTYLGSPFCRLQVCSSHCFCCLPPVAKFVSGGCVGFLVEGTGACVVVDEAWSCLSGGQDHLWSFVCGCQWPYYDFRQPLC